MVQESEMIRSVKCQKNARMRPQYVTVIAAEQRDIGTYCIYYYVIHGALNTV